MGVDAEMFVKLKGRENWLKPEEVGPTAYAVASTLGPEHFLITVGDERFKNSALFGRAHHALSIVPPVTAEEAEEYGQPERAGKVVIFQDGPEIVAGDDEQFVKIHLCGRYYGERYARGDWPFYRMLIEWLWRRFPQGEVWYGGDSSGICAERMNRLRVSQLDDLYLESGNLTYQRAFASAFDRHTGQPAPICPACQVMTIHCGGGQDRSFWYCDGCGQKAVTSSSGTEWRGRHGDFFSDEKASAN